MAYSEVQYPAQHCAVRPQQYQSEMQFYQGVPNVYNGTNQEKTGWYGSEDHNANSNYRHESNYQRPSPQGQTAAAPVWSQMSQQQFCNANMFNGKGIGPVVNSNGYGMGGTYRQRINSAASDGYGAPPTNQWMTAPSPTLYSPTNQFTFPRSRQGSITDQGQLTPDNYYHTQQNYSNQCMPTYPQFRTTSTPGSCGTNSPTSLVPMPQPQLNAPVPQTQQVPPGEVPIPGKGASDWELECMGVGMKLANSSVWKNFENVVTEMVISKHGRRMFPVLEYELNGLNPNKLYNVFLDFVLANCYVWKYVDQGWHPNGLASNEEPDFQPGQKVYLHPDSPAPGDVWNKKGASFNKMKLSNHYHEKEKIITLRTLHKYQPRLHIVEVDHMNPNVQSNLRTFVLPKTTFMTVTLYHDTDVAQLKINLNPFARSFRDKSLTKKPCDESSSSNSSGMSQSLSPVTSPENVETTGRDVTEEEFEAADIVKIENPVNPTDLEKAKQFLHKQLNVMSQLVRTSEELERNSGIMNGGVKPIKSRQPPQNAGETLEELLKPQTVHHFAPATSEPPIIKQEKSQSDGTATLANYQLLNIDRCFPPNAVAACREKLPFDPSQLKTENESKSTLPAFYGCSLYREQAAAAAAAINANTVHSEKENNPTSSNLPVVYVPTPSVLNNNNRNQSVTSPQPPSNTGFTSPRCDQQPSFGMVLPTLSPNCLRDILQEDGNGSFPVSQKRKHCFDDDIIDGDVDDDVFSDSPPNFDFVRTQAKRSCYDVV